MPSFYQRRSRRVNHLSDITKLNVQHKIRRRRHYTTTKILNAIRLWFKYHMGYIPSLNGLEDYKKHYYIYMYETGEHDFFFVKIDPEDYQYFTDVFT